MQLAWALFLLAMNEEANRDLINKLQRSVIAPLAMQLENQEKFEREASNSAAAAAALPVKRGLFSWFKKEPTSITNFPSNNATPVVASSPSWGTEPRSGSPVLVREKVASSSSEGPALTGSVPGASNGTHQGGAGEAPSSSSRSALASAVQLNNAPASARAGENSAKEEAPPNRYAPGLPLMGSSKPQTGVSVLPAGSAPRTGDAGVSARHETSPQAGRSQGGSRLEMDRVTSSPTSDDDDWELAMIRQESQAKSTPVHQGLEKTRENRLEKTHWRKPPGRKLLLRPIESQ
eukprot:gene28943-32135_t